jgi:hypothetical protein
MSVCIHFAYFLLLFVSSKIRQRTFLYVNHAIIVSTLNVLNIFAYVFGSQPNFEDQNLNKTLCTMGEIFWAFMLYQRTYSVLLIAMYRYLAVFKLTVYKKLNDSNLYWPFPL